MVGCYVYGLLTAAGLAYFLLDVPVQLTDSLRNLLRVSETPLPTLVMEELGQQAYLRPFLTGLIRVVYDVSGGRYFEWFRGWHVAQVIALILLFLRIVRPRTGADAVVVPLGLAVLIGAHTFTGMVREAFPINTFMTIALCCYAAVDLALGPPRVWRAVAAAALLIFAALTVETGLLVAVIFVTAYVAGARGVPRAGMAAIVLLAGAYVVLRLFVLDTGVPGLVERSSGFGFSVREPDELVARFGDNPLPFYAYNVASSIASLLFAEPRSGVWTLSRGIVMGEIRPALLIATVACTLSTGMIGWFVWSRRDRWRRWRFERDDQLLLIFLAVAAANAVLCYPYTKDVVMSPAGAMFAVAVTISARAALERLSSARLPIRVAGLAFCLLLSSTWAFRAVGVHVSIRDAGTDVRNEWAYVEQWQRREGRTFTPAGVELKRQLEEDAVMRHPGRPELVGGWLDLFEE
jgi:hypothetical protein